MSTLIFSKVEAYVLFSVVDRILQRRGRLEMKIEA